MQLTKLDHWLKQKFVYETHIFCLRLPDKRFRRSVKVENFNTKKSGDYKYKLRIKKNKEADRVIKVLKEEHIMHAAHIVEGKSPFNGFVMPSGGKSFSYQLLGRLIILTSLVVFLFGIYRLYQNEEVRSKVESAFKELNVK